MLEFFFGLDLGQANDPTAIAVLERVDGAKDAAKDEAKDKLAAIRVERTSSLVASRFRVIADNERPNPLLTKAAPKPRPLWHYHLRFLKRYKLGTSYPAVVDNTKEMMVDEALKGKACLIVDATGVGRPVVDLLRLAKLQPIPVLVHGGDQCIYDKETRIWRVPKRELVSTAKVLFQQERLKFAESLTEVKTLVDELLRFEVKISAAGHDSYGAWREGVHDDLVFALCLSCWWAEKVAQAEEHQGITTGQRVRVVR